MAYALYDLLKFTFYRVCGAECDLFSIMGYGVYFLVVMPLAISYTKGEINERRHHKYDKSGSSSVPSARTLLIGINAVNSSVPVNQIEDQLKQAISLQAQGNLLPASKVLEQILVADPDNFTALHGMGVLFGQMGQYEESLKYFAAAVAVQPDNFAVHYNQGNAFQQLTLYDEALACYDKSLSLRPDFADAYNNRGNILYELHRYDEALANFDKALRLKPGSAEVYNNRGNTLRDMNRHEDALVSYDQAISLKPEFAESYSNRGISLRYLRRYDDALACCERAIALKPDYVEAYNNLGLALNELQRYEDALACYERAIAIKPDYALTYNNRGVLLQSIDQYEDAFEAFNQAIALDANCPFAHGYRLAAQMNIGLWRDFDRHVKEVVELVDQGFLASVHFPLLAIPASPGILQKCAARYAADKYLPAPKALWQGERYDHDRIRIGYFSADFRKHVMAYQLAEMFEKHDRSRFEIFAFSFGPNREDEMRSRLRKAFDHFFDVSGQSDREIVELARRWEIDIAVDLMGYTRNSRPTIFAHRSAPVQVAYLGYPGTTGAPFMDNIIADTVVIPKEHFEYYTEKVVQLPHSYQVNDSQHRIADTVLTRSALALPEQGFVFCCFNNTSKITPDVFDIWMRLLGKVDGSVLWLFAHSGAIKGNLRCEAQKRGIDPERLVFAPHIEIAEHLARQRQADLFLDTFYYNAHGTASNALWAGLPVLTCLGNTFAGRVAASLLYAVGLPELVTRSHEEYESKAFYLAANPDALADIRRKLACNRSTYPLFDSSLFTRHIESAYTAMWQRSRQGLEPDHIYIAP